ncbi:uncharacterized protein SEPMUDRAFT_151913 [Sphaerulina musiva SO2202]|uniref:Uncharacterized protein n=1 Tax=Sphaerulina musiva (strain SO2202) TaxID=692275 RepID=M3CB52_SPHMS|nr:uncharacterized protein SEPMUDRAFT_151913 [Sphaerulina musiva SO2202]EMF09070.1 hypothetical protein SEPMUDRAFT_151913 [Sphaerulina musiva SO2202]
MDALGTEFVNICFEPRVMHAVIEEPGSLAVWNTLTTKYPGCEMVCPPTKVDHIACQAYENGLRAAAHQAMSPLSDSGRFEAPSQKQSNPGPPTFYSNRPRSDMPDAECTCTCLTPETKCSSCIWMTLNGLVETKKRAMTRTCHGKQCFDCRAILDGRETIGKCSYCCGLEINEPN